MLGNLGYSAVDCDSLPLTVGHMGFQCSYGKVGQIYDYGLHERNDEDTIEMCINSKSMLECKPDHPDFIRELNKAIGQQQYSFKFKWQSLYMDPSDRPDFCFNDAQNSIFVQYSCEQTEEQLRVKYNRLCMVVATGILTCLLFLLAIRKVVLSDKIQMAEWDLNTVVVGDYSV